MHFDGSACGGWVGGLATQRCSRSAEEVKFTPAPSHLIPTGEVQVHEWVSPDCPACSPSESPAPHCNQRLHLLWLRWGRRAVRCLWFINKCRGGGGGEISAMQREVWVVIMVLRSAVKAAVGERGAEGAMRADGLEVQ